MKKKRIFQYDLMRVIFMLMVLGVHVLSFTKYFAHQYNSTWYLATILTDFFMIGNPLFFMLSGKFNLDKDFSEKDDYKKFYKKKAVSILLPFFIISLALYILKNFSNINVLTYAKGILSGRLELTYWFVYILIGMLTFSPFFSKMLKGLSDFEKKLFLAIDFAANTFIVAFAIFGIENSLNFTAMGIAFWHIYYFAGYLVEDIFKTKKSRNIVIVLGLIAFGVQFVLRRFMVSEYRLTDPSPMLTLEAFALYFIILDKIKISSEKIKKAISYVANYSFTFYLLHITVVSQVSKFFDFTVNEASNIIYGIIIFIISFIITLIGSIVLNTIIIKPIQKFCLKNN